VPGVSALLVAAFAAVVLTGLVVPAGRRLVFGYFRLLRWIYAEWPLRKITGRRRPDYGRIAELERETGIGQPVIVHAPPNATPAQIAAARQEAVRLAGGLMRPAEPPPLPWQPRTGWVTCDVASGRTCPPHVYVQESAGCVICGECPA